MRFTPGVLIASPQMKDGNFAGTVILVWLHDDDGAMGVVLNRATQLPLERLLEQLDIMEPGRAHPPVMWGGPVEPGAGFLMLRDPTASPQGWALGDLACITTSRERLEDTLKSNKEYRLFLGYSGWGPGQLDLEIQTGSWLYTELDAEMLFSDDVEGIYERALASLGLQPNQVWMTPVEE